MVKSDWPKTMDFNIALQAIEANPANSTQRVSSELGFSQFHTVCYLHNHNKSIWKCWIVLHSTKIFKNFWLTFVFWLLSYISTYTFRAKFYKYIYMSQYGLFSVWQCMCCFKLEWIFIYITGIGFVILLSMISNYIS